MERRISIKRIAITIIAVILTLGICAVPVNFYAAKKKTVTVSAKGVSISKKNKMTINVSAGVQLTVKYGGKKVSASKAKYSSSNKKVATVSKKGYITARKKGKTTISVKYKGKTKKITLSVTTPKTIAKAGGATIKSSKLTLNRNARRIIDLYIGYKPSGAKKWTYSKIAAKKVTYKSSNTKIATINKSGLLVAKKAGKTTITMSYKGVSKKFVLTVTKTVEAATNTTTPNITTPSTWNGTTNASTTQTCSHNWVAQYKTVHVPAVIGGKSEFSTVNGTDVRTVYTCSCGKKFSEDSTPFPIFELGGRPYLWKDSDKSYAACIKHVEEMKEKGDYHTYTSEAQYIPSKYLYTEYYCGCGHVAKSDEENTQHAIKAALESGSFNGHSFTSQDIYEDNNMSVELVSTYIKTPAITKQELTGYKCSKCGSTK